MGIFRLSQNAIEESRLLDTEEYDVFTFGRPPVCIEILIKVKGLKFDDTYNASLDYENEELKVRVVHFNHLIISKRSGTKTTRSK